jgi:serine/threonine-protein kinase
VSHTGFVALVDVEVARLLREERLLEAAALAEESGDLHTASVIYERACAWGPGARTALEAGEAGRALELAIEAGDDALASRALERVGPGSTTLEALASKLSARGREGWAARLLEAAGKKVDAAAAWDRAGEPIRAAELREKSGDAVGAAKGLEAALRRNPHDWTVTAELGGLLSRYGRLEAAVRVLQRVPPTAPERRGVVALLASALTRLGLRSAVEDVRAEAAARGWSLELEPHATVDRAPAPQARLFGQYAVVREVASSATARVLECLDVVRGERVAVKVFSGWAVRGEGRDAVARFDREVRAMRALDHPHIVPMLDFVPEGPAIVLAWMAGGTLEDLLGRSEPIAPARAAEIAEAVLSALGEAHRIGILHRDIKPANVLFDGAGGARLTDFGVAHLGDISTTATAGAFGTLAYMSPEQREGRAATARSDLFAVGVMLREMITGERPPAGGAAVNPSQAHRGLGRRHDELLASMTAVDPLARPSDAFVARAAILALPWPAIADPVRLGRDDRAVAPHQGARLEAAADGTWADSWTGRIVEQVPLLDTTLARARAFARADHPGLQIVLRVDRQSTTIWLEGCPSGVPDRSLTPHEREMLSGALDALHATGAAHGRVDRAHLAVSRSGSLVLRFGGEPVVGATAEADRDALARL